VTHGLRGRHVLLGGLMVAALVAAADTAAAQAPSPSAPSTPPAPERGRQVATDARYKVRVMEGVLEKSVQQAALRLNEQLQRVSPDLIQLAGAAHARGYRLEG
jgi:hypothetical protein